jgi:transcriptional regulator with XRE-family HTH domain
MNHKKDASEFNLRTFKKLGIRYRQLRQEKGLVQEDSIQHGFSVRHYQQLEAGRPHSLTTLFRVAKMFGVKASKILKDIDE